MFNCPKCHRLHSFFSYLFHTQKNNNNKNKIYKIGITSLVFLKSLFIVYFGYNPISFLQNFLYFYVTVSIIFFIQLAAKFLLLLFIKYIKNRKKVQQGRLSLCKSGASSPIPKIFNICAVAYEFPPRQKSMLILAINILKMYKI